MTFRESQLVEVGFFKSCMATTGGENRPLAAILTRIRDGEWKDAIGNLRRLPLKSPSYDQHKKRLPCFMLSASTGTGGHKAADIDHHSGLLQIDVDGLGDTEAIALRDSLGTDPHIFAAWLSPSAQGVKAAMCISPDPEEHKRSFKAAQGYIRARYGAEIDHKCSDPCRLCFVSYDPELRINEGSSPLPLEAEARPVKEESSGRGFRNQGGCAHTDSSESLNTEYESSILHNMKLFQDFPVLARFYDLHVEQRLGKPQPGHRNKALVELVAGTFCVVHPRFVLEFADIYYQTNLTIFAGYDYDDYRKETQNLLAGCLRNYPTQKLSAEARTNYAGLTDDTARAVFRICESLAACESDPSVPPPFFFLGAESLGIRVDELAMTAWRIMQRFEKLGIIQTVETGRKRVKGQKRMATRWKWCPPLRKE